MVAPRRRRLGIAAIAALAVGWALTMHAMGWGQLASYAQVRALADGQAEIDRWHWETKDKAWIDHHFYSVKAPGLAFATLPPYLALDALGAQRASRAAARNVREVPDPRWKPYSVTPFAEHGFSAKRADRNDTNVETGTPMVWALTLFGALLPAVAMLLCVRSIGDRVEPGFGTLAALTLGLATMVMVFAGEYFPHVAAAALGFGAFAVLMRERRGPPRIVLVGAAGLLAGLAVSFEYPLALAGTVLFVYALTRPGADRDGAARRPGLARAGAFAAGALLGVVPVLAFNAWAFGSPLEFAYANAVEIQGLTGHQKLGLNDDGFFGIAVPDPGAAVDLLLSGRGLLVVTPIVAMAVAGAIAMRRGSHRAEANVILAIAAIYLFYNAGYWLPFGGGTPGPRFLIATLPYLAVGLAVAWKRWPAATLALALPSALFMVSAAITHPLVGEDWTGTWSERLWYGQLEHTLLTAFGVRDPWVAIAPVLLAVGAAIALAAAATPRLRFGHAGPVLGLLAGWALVSTLGPSIAGDAETPLSGSEPTLSLIAAGAACSLVAVALLVWRERRDPASAEISVPAQTQVAGERAS